MKSGVLVLTGFAAGILTSSLLSKSPQPAKPVVPLASGEATHIAATTGQAAAPIAFSVISSSRTESAAMEGTSRLADEFAEIIKIEDPAKRRWRLDRLFQKWVLRDAPGAANFALGIESEDLRRESLLRVAQNWAVQEPKDAMAWIRTAKFETGYEQQMATRMVCTQVAREDPREAIQLALDYHLNEEDEEILGNLTSRWAELDTPAARDWAASQPAGKQRDGLMLSIARTLGNNNPAGAAKFLLQQIPPGDRQNEAVLLILPQWALVDMPGARAWADLFPEGPVRDRAMDQLDTIMNRQFDDDP